MTNFPTEARTTLRVLGTAVEEGRMSLPLAALQLAALYRRYGILMSEVTAGVVVARWVGSRPCANYENPNLVPPGESDTVARLRTQIEMLDHLAGLARPDTLTVTAEDLHRMRTARARLLHGMGHTLEETDTEEFLRA